MADNNTNGKTLISDYLTEEELKKRKVFFIMDEMLSPELFHIIKKSGYKFKIEHCEGFKVFTKLNPD